MGGPGQTGQGAIQRAELFANVTLLQEDVKNLIATVNELEATLETTLRGCKVLVECDTVLGNRLDEQSRRIDIVNKRLRRLEDAIGEISKDRIICNNTGRLKE